MEERIVIHKARFYLFGAVLMAGTVAAVSTLVAQTPDPPPRPQPYADRRFMFLDGRGSQLGVVVDDVDTTGQDSKTAPGGVRIEDVDHDSPAERAGLREGDIVVEYDGERVRSARQFTRLVQETPEGRTVAMAIVRGGQRQTVKVTPEGRAAGRSFDVDGERLQRDIERGMRAMPDLREFRFDGPAFKFEVMPQLGPRGRLGVQVDELSPQLADYFGAKAGGVLVTSVTENSAAARAGLKAGDVITSLNGTPIRDYNALSTELQKAAGSDITIGALRDHKEVTFKATLEDDRPREVRPSRNRRPA
jgi:S1-C subfamily serine protease